MYLPNNHLKRLLHPRNNIKGKMQSPQCSNTKRARKGRTVCGRRLWGLVSSREAAEAGWQEEQAWRLKLTERMRRGKLRATAGV
jgi:hypothetical protein